MGQAIVALATPLLSATIVAIEPMAATWAAFVGMVVSIADVALLDPLQKTFRERGAKTQEEFDCAVLDLPWNDLLADARVSPEAIHEAAKKYRNDPKAPVEDWYPTVVDELPLYQARIICQRASTWWDAKLRRRYANSIYVTLGAVSLFVVVIGLINQMSLDKFVLAVLAPLTPAILWASREARRHNEVAKVSERLADHGLAVWRKLVSGQMNERQATETSRRVQDLLFIRRYESPFVVDWVYRLLREQYEDEMNAGAQAMVQEIRRGGATVVLEN